MSQLPVWQTVAIYRHDLFDRCTVVHVDYQFPPEEKVVVLLDNVTFPYALARLGETEWK